MPLGYDWTTMEFDHLIAAVVSGLQYPVCGSVGKLVWAQPIVLNTDVKREREKEGSRAAGQQGSRAAGTSVR